ncbi:Crp/Fnr family transcriptional regulator [Sphingomonas cavernae]|uniref:Crp/Fnr family transcriptional regulator n=1 Tax=Sphingomonas cavernae TaxID=2320861 RepID=A0A418WLW4_9SPHN|nr:Crp/Fnr family transcriptional regulator [Sphingomonas cavernae]RJF90988.1 Crp/Fnr family transcriptional regulator [Sphingomonas cavernae]
MKAEQLSALLPEHSIFASCSEEELAAIILHGVYQTYKKGRDIVAQGDEGTSLFIMLTGTARISMVASNGREIILDYAEPGSVIGEIALLDGGERTASVTTLEEVTGLRLSRESFEGIVAQYHGMALRILRELARRLRQANATIESDRAYATGPRLARFLQRLTLSGGTDGRLRLDLSQGELGMFAGMSREQINRQLGAWSDSGIIALEGGRIRIMDSALLAEIAETAE